MSALDKILPTQNTKSSSSLDAMFGSNPVYPSSTPDIQSSMSFGDKIKSAFAGGKEGITNFIDTTAFNQQPDNQTFVDKLKSAFQTEEQTYKSTLEDTVNRIYNVVDNWGTSSTLQKGANLGSAGLGLVNTFFAPITSTLKASENLPGVGPVARSINDIFGAVGSFASGASEKVIDNSSLSPETKTTLKPVVSELSALLAQIALGKAGEVGISKTTDLVRAKELTKQVVETVKNDPKVLQVKDVTGENKIPVSTPMSRLADYSKSQGYEPYNLDRTLPVIEAGKVTSDLPTIQIGGGKPRAVKGDFVYEPIKLQEARKYKSAEEFVKEQQPLYHGTTNESALSIEKGGFKKPSIITPEKGTAKLGDNVFFTRNKEYASRFADVSSNSGGKILEVFAPNIKLAKIEDAKGANLMEKLTDLKARGFDGSITGKGRSEEIAIWNLDKIKTKSQLIDIWNKTQKIVRPEVTPTTRPVVSQPSRINFQDGSRTTKVASDASKMLVEKGFKALSPEEQSTYTPQVFKQQVEDIAKMIDSKFEQLKNMALGKEPTGNLNPSLVFNAIAEHANKTGNIELIRELGKSPYGSKLSQSAQVLSGRGFNLNRANPVEIIREVINARKARVQQNIKNVAHEIERKIPKVSKQTWSQFIEEIKC